jgi:hypothetical protein
VEGVEEGWDAVTVMVVLVRALVLVLVLVAAKCSRLQTHYYL